MSMSSRAELKAKAKQQIRGNIGILFVLILLAGLISAAATPLLIGPFLMIAFNMSMIMIFLGLAEGGKPEINSLFKGFSVWGKAVWLDIITGFFIFLWTMLLFIPGIVKSFSYSMAPYILAENPHMTAREALRESKRITKGHKMQLFVLQLSFFWWIFLCMLTFGIAFIYVGPYMQATVTNFYREIRQ